MNLDKTIGEMNKKSLYGPVLPELKDVFKQTGEVCLERHLRILEKSSQGYQKSQSILKELANQQNLASIRKK